MRKKKSTKKRKKKTANKRKPQLDANQIAFRTVEQTIQRSEKRT
jgi:hypothetical protein